VDIDPRALGYQLQAIVRIRPMPGKLHLVQEQIKAIPEISECDKITGEDCFIARLFIPSIDKLDEILDRIADKAETNTSLIKSHTIPRRLPPLIAEGPLPRSPGEGQGGGARRKARRKGGR
jgi:Lrp/AsnC family leucine-responsive transcriptional regulator